jgi:hypothetical protein
VQPWVSPAVADLLHRTVETPGAAAGNGPRRPRPTEAARLSMRLPVGRRISVIEPGPTLG